MLYYHYEGGSQKGLAGLRTCIAEKPTSSVRDQHLRVLASFLGSGRHMRHVYDTTKLRRSKYTDHVKHSRASASVSKEEQARKQ